MRKILFLILAFAACGWGADHHCIPGVTGGDGSTWSSPFNGLPSTLTRGDTYYLGKGAYGAYTADDAASGTDSIYLIKATTASHGSATGWNDTLHGAATFTGPLNVNTSYWVIDGKYGNRRVDSAYGIQVDVATTAYKGIQIRCYSSYTGSHVRIAHVDVEHMGMDLNDNNADCIYLFGLTADTVRGITMYDSWIHNSSRTLLYARNCKDVNIYRCYFEDRGNWAYSIHGQAFSVDNSGRGNWNIYDNVFHDIEGTGIITIGLDHTTAHSQFRVWNNLFFTGVPDSFTCSDGVFTSLSDNPLDSCVFYGNTIHSIQAPGASMFIFASDTVIGGGSGGNYARNNLLVGCDTGTYKYVSADYNGYYNTKPSVAETHQVTVSAMPFTDTTDFDYTLTRAVSGGVTLASPYDIDFTGATRGDDGGWDIGAYEYDAPTPLCTLTIAAGTGGTVSPSGAQSDTCGDSLQIIATPGLGYTFAKWTRSSATAKFLDSLNDTTKVFRTDSAAGTVTVTANFTQRANHILVWNSSSSTNMNLASNYWDSTTAAAADTILSGDTLLWTNKSVVNATATASRSVGHIVTASTYSGAWSISGYVWTCANGALFDGTGTLNLGNGMTCNGASGTLHVGSGVGAVTASSCVLTMNGTTGMVLDDDKGLASSGLVIGANANVTSSGSAVNRFQSATPITFTNGGSFNCVSYASFDLTVTGSWITILAGTPTFQCNNANATHFRTIQSSINATMPGITFTGSYGIFIYTGLFSNNTITLSGNVSVPTASANNVFFVFTGATSGTTTLNTNGYSVAAGLFTCGSSAAGGFTANFGATNGNLREFDFTPYNTGTNIINMQSSQWTCSGNWKFGSNHTVNPGTSLITVTGTGTDTHNGKRKYDYTITNSGTGARTFADACTTSGDIIITDGKLASGGNSIYSVGDFLVTSNDSVKLDWTRVGGTFSLGANCIPTFGNNDSLICDSLYFASTNHDSLRGVVVCSSAVFVITPKYTAGARIVSLKCNGVTGAPVGLPITYPAGCGGGGGRFKKLFYKIY